MRLATIRPLHPSRLAVTLLALAAALVLAASGVAQAAGPDAEPRIIGGTPAAGADWPWMAAILDDRVAPAGASEFDRQNCGGALIAPTVVLTAAHCVIDEPHGLAPAAALHVVLGRTVLDGSGGEVIDVAQVVVDPEYRPQRFAHDAALLRLNRGSAAQVAPLADPSVRLREGQRGRVSGWGLTERGTFSRALLTAEVPLWSNARCLEVYKLVHEPALQLCAAARRGGKDVCSGDSGGPLMIRDAAGAWRLLGIVSFGKRGRCGRAGTPTVFSWAASPFLRSWIVRRTAALSSGNPDVQPPALSGFGVAGGRVRYTLSEPAEVVISLQIRVRGGYLMADTALRQNGAAGADGFPTPRTLRGHRLPRGLYRLRATATDAAGNRSTAAATTFAVR